MKTKRAAFEHKVSDALVYLSGEQRVYFLFQLLTSFRFHLELTCYDIDNEENANIPKPLTDLINDFYKYDFINNMYDDYTHPERIENRLVKPYWANFLLKDVIGRELAIARVGVLQLYDFEKSLFAKGNYGITWEKLIATTKSINNEELAGIEALENEQIVPIEESPLTSNLIPWQYSLPDFAELLYKLERRGAISLGTYFAAGGTGAALSRSFCQILGFDIPSGKPAAILNGYLSEIRKGLGKGPLDAGILKAIGRSKGGKMDDLLPTNTELDMS